MLTKMVSIAYDYCFIYKTFYAHIEKICTRLDIDYIVCTRNIGIFMRRL